MAASILERILDDANRADPYPLYGELRRTPVARQADGTHVVSTYGEIVSLLHDPRVSSDPHNRPMVAGLAGRDRIDLVEGFAYPLPVTAICRLLGVPRDDEPRFRRWADALIGAIDPTTGTAEQRIRRRDEAMTALRGYFDGLAGTDLRQPGDDMLSAFVTDDGPDGRMSRGEVVSTAVLLFVAGHETTVNLLANGMLTLLRQPDVLERLNHEPDLIVPLVEELLRYEPPVHFLANRATLDDVHLAGTTIPEGSALILMLAAGSRDPERFDHPDRFDPDRTDNQHLGFGGGIHYCYGAPLARVEAQVALPELARRLQGTRLLADPPRTAPTRSCAARATSRSRSSGSPLDPDAGAAGRLTAPTDRCTVSDRYGRLRPDRGGVRPSPRMASNRIAAAVNRAVPGGYSPAMDTGADAVAVPGPRRARRAAPAAAEPASPADETLLTRVADGDTAALAALYGRHRDGLFGFLLRLAGDRMVAEEILQDALLAVWRSADRFAGQSSVRTWLFGVARRQAHNRLRAEGPPSLPLDGLAERADPAPGPAELAVAGARRAAIADAVAALSVRHREVLALAFAGRVPHREIAEILDVPVGTVKSRLHHARAALARELTERGDVEGPA